MIGVLVSTGGLMENPGSANHRLRGTFEARGKAKQPDFELIGTKEPLHPRVLIHHQRSDQMPVPCFIESKDAGAQDPETEAIEMRPAVATRGQTTLVPREEQQVGVTTGAVGAMSAMRTAVRARQVSDAKRIATWKSVVDLTSSALDRADQRLGPVLGPFPGTYALKARSAVGETNGVVQISSIDGAHRDRLAGGQRLRHTGANHRDSEGCEKPDHSK